MPENNIARYRSFGQQFFYQITLRKTPPPDPPLKGEGSVYVTPPALSGKGDGGLGRMRKVSYQMIQG